MRDVRGSQRSVVTLDRAQLVGLGFFAVLSGGLMFGLGYSAGKVPRPEPLRGEPPILSQIDAEHALHEKIKNDKVDLTFFKKLVERDDARPQAAKPAAEVAKLAPLPSESAKADAAKLDAAAAAKPEAAKPEVAKVEAPKPEAPRALPMPAEIAEPKEPTFASAMAPTSAPEVAKPVLAPVPPLKAPKNGEFTIQVSAFKSEPEADVLVNKLTAKGFKPIVTPLELQGKGTWYRVRVGHFNTAAAAETTKQKLERENFPTWIVKAD